MMDIVKIKKLPKQVLKADIMKAELFYRRRRTVSMVSINCASFVNVDAPVFISTYSGRKGVTIQVQFSLDSMFRTS
ncbi:hypothetical protein RO3G_11931 [Rhizopus delemar RA 99-880]|uniref:Uncharacterized protein n=1 Tax=Rhizopus delemar (strain RA 99-880 / ATCC MYA-4621 / FGSC 9543 / NRRL 43880) TaxID=246409 RepID=I1CFJ0_RHIO9|nr:hypothetical protein RO3G_11931 [Rhizopus delemar RA 99-880]|eukprot:EIE87220.1 hypothetical protein RO3G_11931 [Rhizopus delemar RA 99-880]